MSQTIAIIYLSVIAFGTGFVLFVPVIGLWIADKLQDLGRK